MYEVTPSPSRPVVYLGGGGATKPVSELTCKARDRSARGQHGDPTRIAEGADAART